MQETHQSFRISGAMSDTENIDVDTLNGQNVIYWEDIALLFPMVKYVKNGSKLVKMMRDQSGLRIVPHCIKHCPGVILDVVLSAAAKPVLDDSLMTTSSLDLTGGRANTLIHTPIDPHYAGTVDKEISIDSRWSSATESDADHAIASETFTELDSSGPLHLGLVRKSTMQIQVDMKAMTDAMITRSRAGKELDMSMAEEQFPDEYRRHIASPDKLEKILVQGQAILNQGAMTQQIAREVLDLQKQMNDRLILIQRKTEAILTQQLELAEYPIPRLFIVLPEETTKYDPGNWFRTKFRLYFICECGEHTKVSGGRLPNHTHLAKHEGYLVREPTNFFKKYGPFLLLMLELIKTGINVAGCVVPALASMKVTELVSSAQETAKTVIDIKTVTDIRTVTDQIDYSLRCIDRQLENDQTSSTGDANGSEYRTPRTQLDLTNYVSDVEGLEGVELRQLGSFLKTSKEDNLLGNLYLMTTSDGRVKWVCNDHYRASYQEAHTLKLRDIVKLAGGKFDEQLGAVEITLQSSIAATEFFNAFTKARGIIELEVGFGSDCTRSDLKKLKDALKDSRVSTLRLNLQHLRKSALLSTSAQYEVLFRFKELPNMRKTHILLTMENFKRLSLQPAKPSQWSKLSFGVISENIIGEKEYRIFTDALKTKFPLSALYLESNWIGDIGSQALGEALKTNSTLTTLYLESNSIGDIGGQALGEGLKINSTLTTLNLNNNLLGDIGGQALGEGLKTNSTLTTLDLSTNLIRDLGGQALGVALKTNSTLTVLGLNNNSIGDIGGQALGEALKTNSSLTALYLKSSSIRDIGGQALGEGLKTNSTLTALYLESNWIGHIGGQALGVALKTNSTLTILNLDNNLLGDIGGQALGEGLKTNSTLTTLDLSTNLIRDIGGQALGEALKTNSTLTALSLNNNSIGDIGEKWLTEAEKTNIFLTILR
ncbi:hypothetical protein BGZ83_006226 [Gryganskiella cystojenkinii]|nr:hypothetical protein BGZ83_006226 [Gryganskiella cystojenkinii]